MRQRRQFLLQRGIDPVVVAWDGGPLRLSCDCHPLAGVESRYESPWKAGRSEINARHGE
jgi:hypothetical protein